MKTINQQLDDGKADIVVHLNGETLANLSAKGIDLSRRWNEILTDIIRPEFADCIVVKKSESLKSVMATVGISSAKELKALLLKMRQ